MVQLTIVEKEGEKIGISPKTAVELGIDIGQILIVTNPNTNRKTVGIVEFSPAAQPGTVEMDRVLFESIGLDSGFDVTIEAHYNELVFISEVDLGIMADPQAPPKGEDPVITAKTHEDELLDFVGDRVFMKSSQFRWKEYGLIITIRGTTPKLQPSDVARFGELKSFKYGRAGTDLQTFDGVLLIDISGSMKTMDMYVQDVGWAIDRMRQDLAATSANFLARFQEGAKVKRYDGATLCALLYLVEKIGRGVGDNIAIIPFSDGVHPVMFNGAPFYSSSLGKTNEAADAIVSKVETIHHGTTNMAGAFEEGIEIAKGFDKGRIKMFVLLTDGKADNEDKVLEIIEDRLAPRKDIILNSLGIGRDVNTDLLQKLSRMTGGSFHSVSGLRELTSIYSKYAHDLAVIGSDSVLANYVTKTETKTREEIIRCPTCGHTQLVCANCGKGMRYVDQAKAWYCDACKAYPGHKTVTETTTTTVPVAAAAASQSSYEPSAAAQPSASTTAASVSATGERCPGCGGDMKFIQKYDSWYCGACKKYKQDFDVKASNAQQSVASAGAAPATNKCPKCGKPATYIEKYSRWYCYDCKAYL
jgi:ssDNA-binding Zn-finger/Zn-ribbon topoisomerase 1